MRLAFFGTPQFAVSSLKSLARFCVQDGHELKMVVTQPDKRQNRGKLTLPPPVKVEALSLGLTVRQPETLKKGHPEADAFYEEFCAANIDLAVVVAYGKIISNRLLHAARISFLNVHASLLPRFRGAAPIQRAIAADDRETGVCLMHMVLGLDEGDVYATKTTPIIPSDTGETLSFRLAHLGAFMLEQNLSALLTQNSSRQPQSLAGVVYAHRIDKDEGRIDFSKPGRQLHNMERAFFPWPSLFGFIKGKRVKLAQSFFVSDHKHCLDLPPGHITSVSPYLGVKTIDGILFFAALQVEGKTMMRACDAALGLRLTRGDKIAAE